MEVNMNEQEAVKVPSNSLSTSIAVLASPSRIDGMVEWITSNVESLTGSTLFCASPELADRLVAAQTLSLDTRMLSLHIKALEPNGDVQVASNILAGEIRGVILFKDMHSTETSPDLPLLVRVCDSKNIPLAINKATADLALRGVTKMRVAYLMFNPVAGQGDSEKDLALISSILEPIMILHVVFTEKDRDVAEQAREIVDMIRLDTASGASKIIIGSGGDGTVSAIAGATMGTGIPFGAIPRGTANAFSVALGIPTNVDEACYNILSGHVRVIDGGICNNKIPFINLAGVGFEAGLVDNATRELKNVLGNLAYVFGGAQQAIQQEPFSCVVTVDGTAPKTIETKVITVANVAPPSSVFAQGFGEVIPDDGMFEVTITTGTDALGELEALASLWVNSVVKTAVPSQNLLQIRAKSVTVDCTPPQKLLLDGEVLEANPVTFAVVPNGLTVITPAPTNNNSK